MKRKIIQSTFFTLFFLTIIGCEYTDPRLKIKNSSDKPIFVEFNNDTTSPEMERVEFYLSRAIQAGDTQTFYKRGISKAWSYFIQTGNNKKLYIYLYDLDTVKKYSDMDFINKNRLYLNRFEFTEEELNQKNWTITYPN